MPFYLQRRSETRKVETIEEFADPKEAHRVAAEYNLMYPTVFHYVNKNPCKAWRDLHLNQTNRNS